MSDEKIKRGIAQLGRDKEPPLGWERRVLAAVSHSWWRLAGTIGIAIGIGIVFGFGIIGLLLLFRGGRPPTRPISDMVSEVVFHVDTKTNACHDPLDPDWTERIYRGVMVECTPPASTCVEAIDNLPCRCLGLWSQWAQCRPYAAALNDENMNRYESIDPAK